MKQIDESWYVKADARAKKEYDKFENNDNDYYNTYLEGIYDYKEELLKQLNAVKGSKIHGEIVLPKEYVLNLIETLKTL
jgi:cell fate (sporulation/competence/biofilm development) regulator YlbF (YheA/YmcA/DUF963 family)